MDVTREQVEATGIPVFTGLESLVNSLVNELEYDELVEFVHMIDDEVADSEFTNRLYKRIVEIKKEAGS
jgi:hypothetical protein